MDPQAQLPQAEFLWRRMVEGPPTWALFLPVGFAFLVLALLALFRDRGWSRLIPATIVVAIVSAIYVVAGYNLFLGLFSWYYLLVPTLGIALIYVGLMYVKDARSVHPAVAACLGALRCLVYAILAVVFLLPGCQTFEKAEYHSKVLMLFDVSGSMLSTRDDIPAVGEDPKTLPTRQDKVFRMLTLGDPERDARPLVNMVVAKSSVTGYRFGSLLDESEVMSWKQMEMPHADPFRVWLNPDRKNFVAPDKIPDEERIKRQSRYNDIVESLQSGTNIYGSALQMAKIEGNNNIQAVIVVSDGQSNLGSDEAQADFLNRMSGQKKIKIFTVGVGEFRIPAAIKVDDVQAPDSARPDDKFPVRVQVVGTGLAGEEFNVTLTAVRVKDGTGQPIAGEKVYDLGTKPGKFEGGGDYPQGTVEFEVDVQDLKGIKAGTEKDGELEGTWQFVARVPRNPREAQFTDPEHVTNPPIEVLVMKRKLRVLLFAGGPTREYQFLRTLLYREVLEKRLDMSVYLQSGKDDLVDQDVESERLLRAFPDKIGAAGPNEKYMSLSDYDVIIAIDPDWISGTEAEVAQRLKNVKEWVTTHSGGLVFVAGPVNTFQLARPAGVDITDLRILLPVFLNDSRLHGLGGIGHDASRPYVLRFTPASKNKEYDFLRLDENDEDISQSWNKFFWGAGNPTGDPVAEKPKRGFYNYYPVDKVKSGATVLATFVGPESSRINEGKEEQPFIVYNPNGNGKTMFLGSGEFNRLRQTKAAYHERFWIKLARFMSAGATQQKKYGRILTARSAPIGNLPFEAQLKGKDLLALPAESAPIVYVKRLDPPADAPKKDESFDLKAKTTQGDWAGWFAGTYKAREPGEYEFRIPIPDTNEFLTQRITIRKPNPELDNVRNNFGLLYQLAGDANEALAGLPAETRRKVMKVLQVAADDVGGGTAKDKARLFFKLQDAHLIADCLTVIPPREVSVKGKLFDLWDKGYESSVKANAYVLALLTPLVIGLLGGLILVLFRQYLFAGCFFGGCVAASLSIFALDLILRPTWSELPLNLSFVLVAVVTLLGAEWLTRKLLKLA